MIGKYKVAHLLGIARGHEKSFRFVEQVLTAKGYICFAPAFYNLDLYNECPDLLDDMCYEKLKVCDIAVVVTPDHIGKSTSTRIKQCKELNKPCYVLFRDDLIPLDIFLSDYLDNPESEICRKDIYAYYIEGVSDIEKTICDGLWKK